jgi:uncharacterized protein YgiM (DUF1202 family)
MRELRSLRGALLLVAAAVCAAPGAGSLAADDAPAAAAPASATPYAAVVARDEARVRAGPSANYRVLEKLARGTVVVVTGSEGEFLRVRIPGGVPVFVHGDLLEAGGAGRGSVSRSDVLMRPTPGQDYFPLEGQKLQKGDALTVLERGLGEKGAWVKVLPPDGVEYFVHATLLEKAPADAANDPAVARLSSARRSAYADGAGAAKDAARKAEGDLAALTAAAAAALSAAPADSLPPDAVLHRDNLTQVMTESADPALRSRAADLSGEYLERERQDLHAQARADRTTVQEELRRRLAEIEADYQRKLDEILKAAPKDAGPRWKAVGTVRRTWEGYELVKGEVRLHRIASLRYDLDEMVNLRVGINGKDVAVDPAKGLSIFRVDSLEILE